MLAGGTRQDVKGQLGVSSQCPGAGAEGKDRPSPRLCCIADGWPSPSSFGRGHCHQLSPQPHPCMGKQWAASFLGGSVYFQRSFSLHGEEHPLDFLESLNYRVLEKKCCPNYLKEILPECWDQGQGPDHPPPPTHTQGSWEASRSLEGMPSSPSLTSGFNTMCILFILIVKEVSV